MKIKYGSWSELNAQEAREQRQGEPRPSSTLVVQRADYIRLLSEKMKEYDPDGEKALSIAQKYRD